MLQQRPSLLDPVYSDELAARVPIGDLRISSLLEPSPHTSLDVELALFEWYGEYEGVLACRGDVVPAAEVPELGAEYVRILDSALRRPDAPLDAAQDL